VIFVGPMTIANNSGTLSAEKMKVSWNEDYHLLFLDQPTGVGWSPSGNDTRVNNTNTAATDFYTFLTKFYTQTEFIPLLQYDLYIAGESYAGHYIPAFTKPILENIVTNKIPLKGIMIGDGLTDVQH